MSRTPRPPSPGPGNARLSRGSLQSYESAGPILSIGSAGSILSGLSSRSVLSWRDRGRRPDRREPRPGTEAGAGPEARELSV
jgi:hypothetical protein